MYRHLLVPTDGSARADAMVGRAMAFASRIGARVTGLHVIPEYHVLTYRLTSLQDTKSSFTAEAARHADDFLAALSHSAAQAGVPCDTLTATDDHPWQAIIACAQQRECDLIVMSSHGKRGLQALLIGSETHKVLTHSTIPVLVFR
ncbi:universal stress protein [Cupriavidus taiwanensis]|uniref:Putative universal stress protein, UspA n=1 Tax=Cupriavidus taiwanensis TaxID=164546 RepID=A0A375IRK4_9BURK|nr:universal stress protein [Cupriavidus taiwanensis]SOY68553.1 putative universal stress protein, UspA [Cupriavidus taiwanensis]SOY69950.1 putative universal stress protein, UspA [Cupriavidus taiwanensis]SOY95347.1 putative universal stress protein, UspA [Cupriavidus taiwanensis]SOZ28419.1 putative universal stress protein, UspA [Cupriavidus taiwanensis]SOZ71977.1 putative universal stress protein, UspA [Cupriavidus taiwanensis]